MAIYGHARGAHGILTLSSIDLSTLHISSSGQVSDTFPIDISSYYAIDFKFLLSFLTAAPSLLESWIYRFLGRTHPGLWSTTRPCIPAIIAPKPAVCYQKDFLSFYGYSWCTWPVSTCIREDSYSPVLHCRKQAPARLNRVPSHPHTQKRWS